MTNNVSLVGRYIKVLKANLGRGNYTVGDYLKILEDPGNDMNCHTVEKCGILNITGPVNRVLKGDIELMPEYWFPNSKQPPVLQELSEFPSEGVCWQPNDELREFLYKRYNQYSDAHAYARTSKGLGWGLHSYWGVGLSSTKPEFNIKQLEPFFEKERYYGVNGLEIKPGDNIKVDATGEVIYGIKGIVERIYDNRGTLTVELKRPLPRHPSGGELLALPLSKVSYIQDLSDLEKALRPLTPEECFTAVTEEDWDNFNLPSRIPFSVRNDYRLPDKWCIRCDGGGKISQAVREYANEKGLNKQNFSFNAISAYYYYINEKGYFDNHTSIRNDHTEITFEQFKKHVLTHTETNDEPFSFTVNYKPENNLKLKENGKQSRESRESSESNKGESCKVQRPNLSIRGGDEIRANSIGCSKVKIQVRDGYSSDSL